MEIKSIYKLLPLLPILCACQSEVTQESIVPHRVITVKATLPDSDDTRSYITYGNQNIDEEFFRWQDKDWLTVFNVTRLSDCPKGVEIETTTPYINGRSAIFESVKSVNPNFEIKAGDTIFVSYWETLARLSSAEGDLDERKIFTIGVGAEANKPQVIVNNPTDSAMLYMQSNLKMYDIVTAVEDDSIPDLHFRHLSTIMRVTLRNETGKDLYPTKLEFEYPGTESFFNTMLYCSIDTDSTNESGLRVYTDEEFYNGSKPYTDNIGTTINTKDGTTDTGEAIAPGETYDLYLSTVPRIGNTQKGNGLIIKLIKSHDTDNPYKIILDGFDVAIKAGKRYWFNLTAVEENGENKLMLTSEWLKEHPEQATNDDE
ncbi:MAG: hypothetical protein HDR88_07930 [Bacteroides sp.]|nr:hypothetical protein [Bacteroides sp.]